ncbi:MAG: hypothetical protein QW666_02170 [Candidatus Woesearchaeota archaeon]
MPAIAEREETVSKEKRAIPRKFKQLEEAKNNLISAIAADENNPDSVIYNVQILALSITTRMESMAKQLQKIAKENKEMAEMLEEMVSSEKTAELVPTKKIVKSDVKEAAEAAVSQAVKEAKTIVKNAISEMKRYEFVLTSIL